MGFFMYLTILRIYKYSLILRVMVRQTRLSVTCSNLPKRYYCLTVEKTNWKQSIEYFLKSH
ncbi:unnamed protein product [Brugia pahangi]|uniref:Uncharacterized protein n=1 Tax=Brugia pahangi TaxID=6280 RepID=A0A0N4T5K8_BRUPA|nr:unnamed protein product [Brugia pahangi]